MKGILVTIFLVVICSVVYGQENLLIKKINFEGNHHIRSSVLKDEIMMQSNSWFKEKILKKDPFYYSKPIFDEDINRIKILYQKEGYLNVQFEKPDLLVTSKNKLEITIKVIENEPIVISDLNFKVDSSLALEDVLSKKDFRKIQLRGETLPGKIFRDKSVINDRLLISETFDNLGYPYAKVDLELKIDTLEKTTAVNWSVNRRKKTYFGTTTVTGNKRVPEKNILKQLAYERGDQWSKNAIDETQQHIYNQGVYRVASVRAVMDTTLQDTLPVRIHIQEAPRWTTRFGVGYGVEDKLRAFADIQYLGFITQTGRLNLYTKHSALEPYNFSVQFAQPSFILPFNTLVLNPYMQRQDEPGYKLDKWGLGIIFQQNFSEEFNTSIGYILEDVEQNTEDWTKSDPQFPGETLYRKSGIVVGASYNNAEPILDPVQGYSLSVNTKTNDLIFEGEMPFYRIITEYKTYLGIKNGVLLALKGKIGGIVRTDENDFIPIEEKFFSGGAYSVRGWPRGELGPKNKDGVPVGGNSLLEGTLEFRFDVGRSLKFSVFGDAGNVWADSFSYKINDLHYAAGVGLRIKTPIGPAGLDIARPVFDTDTKWQFHINIGPNF